MLISFRFLLQYQCLRDFSCWFTRVSRNMIIYLVPKIALILRASSRIFSFFGISHSGSQSVNTFSLLVNKKLSDFIFSFNQVHIEAFRSARSLYLNLFLIFKIERVSVSTIHFHSAACLTIACTCDIPGSEMRPSREENETHAVWHISSARILVSPLLIALVCS